jgi:hypothetical protein
MQGVKARLAIWLGVAAAVVLVAVIVIQQPAPSVGEPSPTPVPSAAPRLELAWTQVASFETSGEDVIESIVRVAPGIVVVGTHYPLGLNEFGPPPPHEGRVWLSADGTSWTDVTPRDTFAHAALGPIYETADGALVLVGLVQKYAASGMPVGAERPVTWESEDGRSWHAASTGIPADRQISQVVQGARGYLALTDELVQAELWYSSDGRAWDLVRRVHDDEFLQIGAGDEGFVVTGAHPTDRVPARPFAITSSDGTDWVEADAPRDITSLVSVGGQWYALSWDLGERRYARTATLWSSATGAAWSTVSEIRLKGNRRSCRQYSPGLSGAGGYLFVRTGDTFTCETAGNSTTGTTYVSVDGTKWQRLPLLQDAAYLMVEVDGRLVAAGSTLGRTTFWIGET